MKLAAAKFRFWLPVLPVFLALCILLAFPAVCFSGKIVVVVNSENGVSSLSIGDLRKLFKGEKKIWNDGTPVRLFLPSMESEAMEKLMKKILRKNKPSEVTRFYLRAVFQQKFASPPRYYPDPVLAVSSTPGGICLVDSSEIRGDEVKIIPVDGL